MPDVFDSLLAAISNSKISNQERATVDVSDMEAWLAEIDRLQLEAGHIKRVFVVSINFGCEGHTAPFQAFLSQTEADAARKLFDGGGNSNADFYAVPVWPEPAVRWMDQKPIGLDEP